MSDASQGPGWWLASDGKWYPPESYPSAQNHPSPPPLSGIRANNLVRDQPSYAPTILITIFFGAWGLWPAFRHSRMASQRGYKTDGYWWSFGLSLLVPLGVTAIILVTSLALTHSLSTITTVPSPPLGGSTGSATQSTTTSTTAPASAGGSGNTSPGATTTSADCPASLTMTLNKPSYSAAPPMTINSSKTYTATVTTDIGPFTIQLDPKAAPMAVNSFVFLANQHFYDCIIFHRVIKTFMDQTGDPTGTGDGGPGYQFADELPATANPQYPLGSVAMANSGPNTNGSQFFIVTGPEGESLAPSYTIFGQVTSGMNVVDEINADGASASSSLGTPTALHRIVSVSIEAG